MFRRELKDDLDKSGMEFPIAIPLRATVLELRNFYEFTGLAIARK